MRLLFIVLSILIPAFSFGFTIKGKILNPEGYKYRVSIFHLRNVGEFQTLSDYNLVQYAYTDSAGNFSIQADFVPDEETIYRFHIKRIQFPQDSIGDLITSNFKSGKIGTANYFYIPLTSTSIVSIDIENDENIINNHRTSFPSNPFIRLYSILRNYDNHIGAIHKRISASAKPMPQVSSEIDSLVKERTSSLRDSLFDQLNAFIKKTPNVNAAVIAYNYIEWIFKPSLNKRISLFENIEAKGPKSKYLPLIAQGLEREKEKERLTFLKKYSIATSILSVLLLMLLVLLFLKYRKTKKELDTLKGTDKDIYALLTRKEIEIFEMLADGLSNKEIAAAQFLEISTIKKHITNIYSKTGIKNRNEAAALLRKTSKAG
jgi:DNA-binding CsgD family transcriptional regulator